MPEREQTRIIELLKLRFGEASLTYCEIMIKDVSYSKRMNKLVHGEQETAAVTKAMIVSHLFWPGFKEDTLQLPGPIKEALEEFQKGFRAIKRDRKLEWMPSMGTVILEIELYGETREISVTPAQATILFHFQSQSQWSLPDLSSVTGIPAEALRRRITFWTGQGVLQAKGNGIFCLNDLKQEPNRTFAPAMEDEEDGPSSNPDDGQAAMWALAFNFINACLSNQGPMGVDRIHFMLSTLMREEYRASPGELRTFLEQKVREDQLEREDGDYRSKE